MTARDNNLCCVECFADDYLIKEIQSHGRKRRQKCAWCGSFRKPSVELGTLTEAFSGVVETFFVQYVDLPQARLVDPTDGEFLGDILDEQFQTFSERTTDVRTELACAILNEGLDPRGGDTLYDDTTTWFRLEEDWSHRNGDEHVDEAIRVLRPAVQQLGPTLGLVGGLQGVPTDIRTAFATLESELGAHRDQLPTQTPLFRARVEGSAPFAKLTDLHAPPASLVSAGRANQAGQPVLYVAATPETALAEVRPAIADIVAIGALALNREVELCPLIQRAVGFSPFSDPEGFLDAANIQRIRATLGQELARPIRPGDVGREYLFTQFIANLTRHLGFDGITYPSSQTAWPSQGTNHALFDVNLASVQRLHQRVRVSRVQYITHTHGLAAPPTLR